MSHPSSGTPVQSHAASSQEENGKLRRENEHLLTMLNKEKQQREILERELHACQGIPHLLEVSRNTIQTQLTDTQSKLQKALQQLQTAEAQARAWQAKTDENNTELQRVLKEYQLLKGWANGIKQQRDALMLQAPPAQMDQGLRKELEACVQQGKQLQAQLQEAKQALQRHAETDSQAIIELKQLRPQIAALRKMFDHTKQQLERAEAQERYLKQAIEKWRIQLTKTRRDLESAESNREDEQKRRLEAEQKLREMMATQKGVQVSAAVPFIYYSGWIKDAVSKATPEAPIIVVIRPSLESEAKGELFWLAAVWQEKPGSDSLVGRYFATAPEQHRFYHCYQQAPNPVASRAIFGYVSRVPLGQAEINMLNMNIKAQKAREQASR